MNLTQKIFGAIVILAVFLAVGFLARRHTASTFEPTLPESLFQQSGSGTKSYQYSAQKPLVVYIPEKGQILVYFKPPLPADFSTLEKILKEGPAGEEKEALVSFAAVGQPITNLNLSGRRPGTKTFVFPAQNPQDFDRHITVFVLPDWSENGYLAQKREVAIQAFLRRIYFWR